MSTIIEEVPKMTRIDDLIFLGNSQDHKQAKAKGIEAILNVALDLNYSPPESVEYAHVGLTDDGNNSADHMLEAVDFLADFVNRRKKTLVHCHVGRSRSPCVVALFYNHYRGWTFNSALDSIKRMRPIVDPGEGILLTAIMCSKQVQNV